MKPRWLKTEKKRDFSSASISSMETDNNPKKKLREVKEKISIITTMIFVMVLRAASQTPLLSSLSASAEIILNAQIIQDHEFVCAFSIIIIKLCIIVVIKPLSEFFMVMCLFVTFLNQPNR